MLYLSAYNEAINAFNWTPKRLTPLVLMWSRQCRFCDKAQLLTLCYDIGIMSGADDVLELNSLITETLFVFGEMCATMLKH